MISVSEVLDVRPPEQSLNETLSPNGSVLSPPVVLLPTMLLHHIFFTGEKPVGTILTTESLCDFYMFHRLSDILWENYLIHFRQGPIGDVRFDFSLDV